MAAAGFEPADFRLRHFGIHINPDVNTWIAHYLSH
jgi:hypothetical protein